MPAAEGCTAQLMVILSIKEIIPSLYQNKVK